MRIGELSKKTGVSTKTIRYWESIGLLPKPHRDISGYRTYNEEYIRLIEFILRAKSIGFRLEEIKEILNIRFSGDRPCGCVEEKIRNKISEIDGLIEQFLAKKELLNSLLERRREEPALVCPIIESIR